jgi:hypothetical protein
MSLIKKAIDLAGNQAIIGMLPLIFKDKIEIFNCSKNEFNPPSKSLTNFLSFCDELILYDCESEGSKTGFNLRFFDYFQKLHKGLILSGGISSISILQNYRSKPKAIYIENSILHSEYSVKNIYGNLQ